MSSFSLCKYLVLTRQPHGCSWVGCKIPASTNGPGSRSQKQHFALMQVQCVGKTSPSEVFMSQLGLHSSALPTGVSQWSIAAAPLQWLLVGLVSSAVVSLFSSKLQMSGAEWASFNHSSFPASKQHLNQCLSYWGSCGMGCHYSKDHHPAIPYCSITSPQCPWLILWDLAEMSHYRWKQWWCQSSMAEAVMPTPPSRWKPHWPPEFPPSSSLKGSWVPHLVILLPHLMQMMVWCLITSSFCMRS